MLVKRLTKASFPFLWQRMLPHRIYLSGGGMCAMAHVGALVELSNTITIHTIKEWMGVSAGSLIAMCLSIGYTLEETYDISVRFDFTAIKEVDSIPDGFSILEWIQENACIDLSTPVFM